MLRFAYLVLSLAGLAAAEIRPLTVLHTNDLHARLTPQENGSGGFAHLAAVIRREREGCGHCILVNAGDLVQGTPVSTIFRGLPVYDIANLLAFDAATLGNHDFDYGWRAAVQFMRKANYPIVSANLTDDRGRLFTGKPYVIRKAGGLRVAVIGAITADLPELTKAEARGPWRAEPVLEAVRRHLGRARAEADVVLVVGHLNPKEEEQLLAGAPEVAAIVSGHTHRGLEQPLRNGERVMVRVRSNGAQLGRLDMRIDTTRKAVVKSEWRVIPVDAKTTPAAADVARVVAHWENEVAKAVDTPIGESRRRLPNTEVKLLLERAMRETMKTDFALMNQGGVRDSLPQGTVLARHVWNIMPFDNTVLVAKVRGARLPKSVAAGRTIEPDREYTLATTDFSAETQDDLAGLSFTKDGPLLRDVLIDWIKRQKVLE